jgi:hypothetical protein
VYEHDSVLVRLEYQVCVIIFPLVGNSILKSDKVVDGMMLSQCVDYIKMPELVVDGMMMSQRVDYIKMPELVVDEMM